LEPDKLAGLEARKSVVLVAEILATRTVAAFDRGLWVLVLRRAKYGISASFHVGLELKLKQTKTLPSLPLSTRSQFRIQFKFFRGSSQML
jgi:hypothetical protein